MHTRLPLSMFFTTALAALSACQTTPREPVSRDRSQTPSAAVPSPVSTSANNRELYGSPDDALKALAAAAKSQDAAALRAILGPDMDQIASHDEVEQKAALKRFSDRLTEKAHTETEPDGSAANIYIGQNDYPFPIPLVRDPQGKWFFDTKAGESEILNRRIGTNELDTIDLCHLLPDAQREYSASDHDQDGISEYARRFVSTPGHHDGLYWPATTFERQSPLGPVAAQASADGYPVKNGGAQQQQEASTGPHPFHGYYFKILTRQGPAAPGGAYSYIINGHMVAGFAFLAYPAEYNKSGVMSFIINQNNTLYQKDMGPNTAAKAAAMMAFNPDNTWTPVKDPAAANAPAATQP